MDHVININQLINRNISCYFVVFVINDDIMETFKITFDFLYIYIFYKFSISLEQTFFI